MNYDMWKDLCEVVLIAGRWRVIFLMDIYLETMAIPDFIKEMGWNR